MSTYKLPLIMVSLVAFTMAPFAGIGIAMVFNQEKIPRTAQTTQAHLLSELPNDHVTTDHMPSESRSVFELRKEALGLLDFLRIEFNLSFHNITARHLRERLQKIGLTLEDIGSSEEELARLHKNTAESDALFLLDYFRNEGFKILGGVNYTAGDIHRLLSILKEGDLTLPDVGSSQQEIFIMSCKVREIKCAYA